MGKTSVCEIFNMEVVNVCDGAKLGCVIDAEFDRCDGKMISLVVPGCGGFLGFGRGDDIVIPWCKIVKFGDEIILVDIGDRVCDCPPRPPHRKKFF